MKVAGGGFEQCYNAQAVVDTESMRAGAVSDSVSSDADVGIRYGAGGWDDVEAQKLTDVVIFPVAAPSLLKGAASMKPANSAANARPPRRPPDPSPLLKTGPILPPAD